MPDVPHAHAEGAQEGQLCAAAGPPHLHAQRGRGLLFASSLSGS